MGERAATEEGKDQVSTTIERPDDARDPWLPIFSAGWHLGREWTRGDAARIVANYDLLRTPDGGGVLPPVASGTRIRTSPTRPRSRRTSSPMATSRG